MNHQYDTKDRTISKNRILIGDTRANKLVSKHYLGHRDRLQRAKWFPAIPVTKLSCDTKDSVDDHSETNTCRQEYTRENRFSWIWFIDNYTTTLPSGSTVWPINHCIRVCTLAHDVLVSFARRTCFQQTLTYVLPTIR